LGATIVGNARVLKTRGPGFCGQKPMSMKISAGLQGSGTTDESTTENVEADHDLAELIELHENTDWRDVSGFSAVEAGTRLVQLIEARETIEQPLIERRTVLSAAITLSEMSVSASNVAADGRSDDTNDWPDSNYDSTNP